MSSSRRNRKVQVAPKRKGRTRTYLLIGAVVVLVIGLAFYLSQPTPTFSISAPPGVTIRTGGSTSSIVTVTASNSFPGPITLAATGSQGLTVAINPTQLTGSGTATLTMSAANPGNYSVTVTGTGNGVTHTVTPRVATPIYATLQTSSGIIEVELYQAQAPQTVTNFVNLAKQGFYNNLVWHRIATNPAVIQTGDPYTRNGGGNRTSGAGECCVWGTGGSSQTVPLEIDSSLHNYAGYLGMARGSDINSGTSQFYINVNDNTNLDGNYAVFGRVISGMSVVTAISNLPVDSSTEQPLSPFPFLNSVTISDTP